jgi:probable rRNA maturation factor
MTLEIALDADEEWDSRSSWERLARTAAEAAVAESAFAGLASSERPVEISVTLTGDEQVRALNAEWRGKDRPTNVLSFPMVEAPELTEAIIAAPELLLGDIVLARGVCEAEAAAKAISVQDHAAHLLVHGTLHLLGYDHQDEDTAADMEAREARALRRMGIADPYEATA